MSIERPADIPAGYIHQTDLLGRGWTPDLIMAELRSHAVCTAQQLELFMPPFWYPAGAVEAAEAGAAFQAHRAAVAAAEYSGVNELLGRLGEIGDRDEIEALVEWFGHDSDGQSLEAPRRVTVGAETAVIGRQHSPDRCRRWWIRYDWLGTYPAVRDLIQALEDPATRPGAVDDLGGGRFLLSRWDYNVMTYSRDDDLKEIGGTTLQLIFVPDQEGIAIRVGNAYHHADEDAFLRGYGMTRDDLDDWPYGSFHCVLTDDGTQMCEEIFG